jgi:hypothetical protein
VNPDLDRLLDRLRQAPLPVAALADVERQVWREIAARDARAWPPRLRLSFGVLAVAAAFAWGVVSGFQVAGSAAPMHAVLDEEMDLLPPDSGGFLL